MKLNIKFMMFWSLLIMLAFAGCSDLEKNRGESVNEVKIVFMYKNIPYEKVRFPIEKEKIDYKLMLKYFDGTSEIYTENITWTSSEHSVATIESNGTATLLQVGSTTIKAAVMIDGIDFQAQKPLEVTNNLIDSISISPEGVREVAKGGSRSYIALAIIDGFDFPVPITKLATWTTDSPDDVNISIDGSFAIAQTNSNSDVNKKVNIIAQYRSSSDAVILKIIAPKLTHIEVVSDNNNTVDVNSSIKFDAMGLYSDGHIEEINDKVKWSSSDPSVLKFKSLPKNEATGIAPGDANVTATETKLIAPLVGTAAVRVNQ